MPFTLQKYSCEIGQKIDIFVIKNSHKSPYISQRSLARGRIFRPDMTPFKNGDFIDTEYLYLAEFVGVSRGLKPLFTSSKFAIFDKPSNLMVHPNSKKTKYSLLDEIRFHFKENSNLVHRIDAETSGLVLVARNKKSEVELKVMFQDKLYSKKYLAIVQGELKENITIDSPLKKEGKLIGVRMMASYKNDESAKEATTHIKPLFYNKDRDLTLIEAVPITGRQHQIRVHLYSIGHRILGDPIYGVDDESAEAYLTKTLNSKKREEVTGSHRLWLHAVYLEFFYENINYKLFSKNSEIFKEIGLDKI